MMILAAAQTIPKQGNIEYNLEEHYKFIELAAKNNADLITFPEMSITSYLREHAASLSFSPDDKRLEHLRHLSTIHNIIIIAGAPIKVSNKLFIGSFVIKPNQNIEIYTKQFLHDGEELFFQPSFDYNPQISLQNEKISLAICADIDHASHPENAAKQKNTLYLPSIFFSKTGIADAYSKLGGYAKLHSMSVLMSNFGGAVWGIEAAGKSAFWNGKGELVTSLNHDKAGLLLVKLDKGKWDIFRAF
jgi:predicted amidohydrolase